MLKPDYPLVFVALLCGGCVGDEAPAPDPAQVERLLFRLEAQRAGADDLPVSSQARDKLNRAERLVAPLDKVQSDKIEPELAAALFPASKRRDPALEAAIRAPGPPSSENCGNDGDF